MRGKRIALILAALAVISGAVIALSVPKQSEQFTEAVSLSLSAAVPIESAVLPDTAVTSVLACRENADVLPAVAMPMDIREETVQQLVAEGKRKKAAEEAKKKAEAEAKKKAEEEKRKENLTGSGGEVALKALEYKGYDYVYGGSGPTSFDCSGFTMYIYGLYGYKLPHGAIGQMNYGTAVDKSALQPGDLVFFLSWNGDGSVGPNVGHVGIYIGNDEFIHASNERYGVRISSLNESGYIRRYVTARRIY